MIITAIFAHIRSGMMNSASLPPFYALKLELYLDLCIGNVMLMAVNQTES
jgi:hypothetical protein